MAARSACTAARCRMSSGMARPPPQKTQAPRLKMQVAATATMTPELRLKNLVLDGSGDVASEVSGCAAFGELLSMFSNADRWRFTAMPAVVHFQHTLSHILLDKILGVSQFTVIEAHIPLRGRDVCVPEQPTGEFNPLFPADF